MIHLTFEGVRSPPVRLRTKKVVCGSPIPPCSNIAFNFVSRRAQGSFVADVRWSSQGKLSTPSKRSNSKVR
jgi:hypothetical protein